MAGYANDRLIYPILDLVRDEIRQNQLVGRSVGGGYANTTFTDPFSGIPSTQLLRNHPRDSSHTIVTKALLRYESQFTVDINLYYSDNPYDFSKAWQLSSLRVGVYDPDYSLITRYEIRLHYNDRNMLANTSVTKITEQGNTTF